MQPYQLLHINDKIFQKIFLHLIAIDRICGNIFSEKLRFLKPHKIPRLFTYRVIWVACEVLGRTLG